MNLRRFLTGLLIIVIIPLSFTSCMENDSPDVYDPYKQLESDVELIDNFLAANGITGVIEDPRGVRILINSLGTGLTALGTNKVKVSYEGWVIGSNELFEKGTTSGTEMRTFIAGWQIALSTLPAGTKARLYIPSPLAYQDVAREKIPANSILVFDIDFIDIEETSSETEKLKTDTAAIDTYLAEKSIVATNGGNGLRYVVTEQGSGAIPELYSKVKVKLSYKLFSNDQAVVLSNTYTPDDKFYSRPADYSNGVSKALRALPVGSKATLYIPSGLSYGPYPVVDASNNQVIPANSNVIVDLEVLEIQ